MQAEHPPTLPPGWSLNLKLEADAAGEYGGIAEVWEGETLRCRMVLSRYGQDRAAALARVYTRVEFWVSEWLARPHTGSTSFGDLN